MSFSYNKKLAKIISGSGSSKGVAERTSVFYADEPVMSSERITEETSSSQPNKKISKRLSLSASRMEPEWRESGFNSADKIEASLLNAQTDNQECVDEHALHEYSVYEGYELKAAAEDESEESSLMDLVFDDADEEEGEFSPLSHNPLAKEDQLRPSDLMLLALTERIASKVRMRVSKDLDSHIQSKIFPLLDGFADQLVKHLEVDLLKLIREGIAEATREELERLSKKNRR